MSLDRNARLRIIVLGAIVRWPLGGISWHYLQYAMGLAHLGHDVFFLEDSGDDEWCCYDPAKLASSTDPSYGMEYAEDVFKRINLNESWAYYNSHTSRWLGPASDDISNICKTADLLINVSGVNPIRPWFAVVPKRVFVDTDPCFTQIARVLDPTQRSLAIQHTDFFSFGESIGRKSSTVPDDGFCWQPTRQPIVLDAWPVTEGPSEGKDASINNVYILGWF